MDNGLSLTATPQSNTMSIGSVVAPGIHPDLANDCMMWSGVDLPLQPRPTFHNHLSEAADDSPFYSSPAETCPSPLSDTTFSLPPHSTSSISSASVSIIDHYPKNIINGDVHASPLQMSTPLMRWGADADMPPSHMVPMSLAENLMQPVSFYLELSNPRRLSNHLPACSVPLSFSLMVQLRLSPIRRPSPINAPLPAHCLGHVKGPWIGLCVA